MSDGQSIRFELLARAAGAGAPIVYVVDAPEHPLDLGGVAVGRASSVVRVPVGGAGRLHAINRGAGPQVPSPRASDGLIRPGPPVVGIFRQDPRVGGLGRPKEPQVEKWHQTGST